MNEIENEDDRVPLVEATEDEAGPWGGLAKQLRTYSQPDDPKSAFVFRLKPMKGE